MYHRAKLHADQLHRRRDICPDTKSHSKLNIVLLFLVLWTLSVLSLSVVSLFLFSATIRGK